MTARNIQGHLDLAGPDVLAGWVFDAARPGERLALTVFAGDVTLGGCLADRMRPDLKAGGIGDGGCAFEFPLPPGLSASALSGLRVVIADSGMAFHAGVHHPEPLRYVGRPVAAGGRFRRILLHIGTEKTGSTTLQRFLLENRAALADRGYYIPRCLAPAGDITLANHMLVALYAEDDAVVDDLRAEAGLDTPARIAAMRARLERTLAEELAAAPAHCHTLLVSSEHCQSRLLTTASVYRVRDLLAPHGGAIELLAYLRPQWEMGVSLHGLMVLAGAEPPAALPDFDAPEPPTGWIAPFAYFDHWRLLLRWGSVFGEAALRPRLFDRRQLAGGSVVDDFAAVAGFDPAGLVVPSDENTGVSATGLALAAALRPHLARLDPATASLARDRLVDRLRTLHPGRGAIPARAAAERFMARFADGNERLRARWFPARPRLFEPTEAACPERPATPDPEATLEAAAAMLASLLAEGAPPSP